MFEWFSIQIGIVWKTTQVCLGSKNCFPRTNPSNFRWPWECITAENLPFQLMLTNFFLSRLFFCSKVDHIINYCKRPISYFHIPNLKNVIINNTACWYSLLYLLSTTDNILWERCLQWTTIWPNWWTAPGVCSVKVVIFNIF